MKLSERELLVLDILADNARLGAAEIAERLNADENEIAAIIKKLEDALLIAGYKALIDWAKVERDSVEAVIEVKVTPQRDEGFDAIAARIYRFPEVKSAYLMSGAYDLLLMVEARTLKQLALFVSEKLSVLDRVLSTSTHFMLKTYKAEGMVFGNPQADRRLTVTP